MGTILVLDRGNSSLKACLFQSGRLVKRWLDDSPKPSRALSRIVAEALQASPPPADSSGSPQLRRSSSRKANVKGRRRPETDLEGAIYSSVVPEWREALPRALRTAGVKRIIAAGSRITLPFALLVDSPERVGPDRLAAAAGIAAFGGREAVVIDAGSAVTVDVLAGGAFLGGSIFPGEALLLAALHEGTAALPRVTPVAGATRIPGKDTAQAMRAGSFWGLVGAVKELARRSLSSLSEGAVVWITGGGAEALAPHIGAETRLEPDLVAIGLHYLYRMNAK